MVHGVTALAGELWDRTRVLAASWSHPTRYWVACSGGVKDRPEVAGQHLAGYAHRVAMSNSRLVATEGAFCVFVGRSCVSSFVRAAGGPPRRYAYAGIVAARVAGDRE